MLCHELLEVHRGVLAPAVLAQQPVQVAEHVADGFAVLVGGVLQGLFHAGEPLVQDFASQEVLDAFVRVPGGARLPVVGGEFVDRCCRGRRQVLQLHLPDGAVGVVHHGVPGQLFALFQDCRIQQFTDGIERAVEPVPAQQVLAPFLHAAGQVVQAVPVPAAAPEELLQGVAGRVTVHHVLGHGIECLGEVHGRGQRVRTAGVPAVP